MTRARDLADGADKDITGTLTLDDIVLSNDMSVADNGKVQFGAGNDLQIFHNASASYITDQGTGNLVLGGDAAILLQNSAHSANMLDAYNGGRVGLYHNGTLKAATTGTGVDVTGTVTADGLTVDGISRFNNYINFGGTISTPQTAAAIYRPADNTLAFSTANTERLRIDSSGNVLVGRTDTSSTTAGTVIYGGSTKGAITQAFAGRPLYINRLTTDGDIIEFAKDSTTVGLISVYGADMFIGTDDAGLTFNNSADLIAPVNPTTGATRNGAIDLGASNARFKDGYFSGILYNTSLRGQNDTDTGIDVGDTTGSLSNTLTFLTGGGERMRIDASGNVLVGTSANNTANIGHGFLANGAAYHTRDGEKPLVLNRKSSDGAIVSFRQDDSEQGYISTPFDTSLGIFGPGNNGAGFVFQSNYVLAPGRNGSRADDIIDFGNSTFRFNDAFIVNGVTTGSDENEKQQIASLTDAEMTAAKAISKLFKTFKWNSAVTLKGNAARTHTGVMAQQVAAALTDAGLDAGDYAFYMSDTWWEADGQIYYTADEAPEGATQRTRLGIRYPELLAFVGAATEQRLADIETRLTALEAAE
jgi:hypothetical protein